MNADKLWEEQEVDFILFRIDVAGFEQIEKLSLIVWGKGDLELLQNLEELMLRDVDFISPALELVAI